MDKRMGRRAAPPPEPVIDMPRALAEYVERWRQIPAADRQAIVNQERVIRMRRYARRTHARVA